MDGASQSLAVVAVGALVVLAGCGTLGTGGPLDGSDTETASPGGATDGPQDTTTPSPTKSPTPTATPTATPTRTPTPTVVSETGIRVVEINANVEDVSEEYIVLKNTGDRPLDLSGWRVKDEDGHVYTFPDGYTLGIDEAVTLHSDRGTQTKSDRFWWADSQVWDAGGDTIAIYDDRGHKVYERSYS